MKLPDRKPLSTEQLEVQKLQLEVKGLSEKHDLEKKKLELEIQVLRHTFVRTLAIALITAFVSVTIAVGGWLIQQHSEDLARTTAEKNRRDESFTRLVEGLGSTNPASRMSSAAALSQFGGTSDASHDKQTVVALTNRLAVEDDLAVDEQIIDTLTGLGKTALHESAASNRRAAMQFVHDSALYVGMKIIRDGKRIGSQLSDASRDSKINELSRELRSVGFPLEQTSSSTTKAVFLHHLLTGYFQRRFNSELQAIPPIADSMTKVQLDDAVNNARNSVYRSTRFFEATSIALEHELTALSSNLRAENLDGIILLGARLERLDLRGVSFRKAFIAANGTDADLSFCDFSEAYIENMVLDGAKFRGATLTKTVLSGAAMGFEGGKKADLTGANWWDALERSDEEDGEKLQQPQWLEQEFPRTQQENLRRQLLQEWQQNWKSTGTS